MEELKKIFYIGQYTFVEIYKGKILYNVLLLGLFLIVLSYVAAEFTYGVPAKVALDFGLGSLYLSSVGIALFLGATLISKEVENRTVYMILSRPIRRSSFLLGRIFGMAGILLLNNFILACLTLSMFFYLDGLYEALILWSIFFAFLESFIILVLVIFLSLMSNTVITVLSTMTLYVVGHGIGEAKNLFMIKNSFFLQFFVENYGLFFPNFSKLNIKQFVLYQQAIENEYLLGVTLYVFTYITALALLACFIFERKNLD